MGFLQRLFSRSTKPSSEDGEGFATPFIGDAKGNPEVGANTGSGARSSPLPEPAQPKVRPGSSSIPSFFTSADPDRTTIIPRTTRDLVNTDFMSLRNERNTYAKVRSFIKASPNLSSAVWAYMRLGIPERCTVIAYNLDGTFNRDATALAQQLIIRFNVLPDYSEGFSGTSSIRSCSEQLANEIIHYGGMAAELVLGKDRLPRSIRPISVTQIDLYPDNDKTVRPIQRIGQDEIDLDIPTFFMQQLDQDLLEPYSESPFETAMKPSLLVEDFLQDIHRIVKKVIHPRQRVIIDEEKFRRYLSAEAQMDTSKAVEEMQAMVAEIESQVNGLRPEDALVYFDMLGFQVDNSSSTGLSEEYKTINDIANSRMASGAKTMGTVMGFQSGSSNIASVETMLFMKSATGAVKAKLDEMYSRIFTLAVRLFGVDCYVKFEYEAIDLRPDLELESFKQTRQMRIMEQLSTGMITDDEACIQLTGHLPPLGAPLLSGTMFKAQAGNAPQNIQNPSNDGSTLNQNLNPDTPTTGRGQNRRAEAIPIRAVE